MPLEVLSESPGPFDAKAAAIIDGFVYISPNQDVIWSPTKREPLYLRSDFRYGPHDITLWPQFYLDHYPHLGAVPSRPMDPADPLSIMWWNPSRGDFISSEGGVLDGLGQLRQVSYNSLTKLAEELHERVTSYRYNTPQPNPFVFVLDRNIVHACSRLRHLKTTFNQMLLGVTELQHYYLELRGMLDFLEIYKLRIDGALPAATVVEKCVGAITIEPRIAQDFFTAGIPVWLTHTSTRCPFFYNENDLVTPFEPSRFLCLDKPDPPFPTLYNGPLNVRERHDAIHGFSRNWLVLKDSFEDTPSSTPSPTTQQPSMSKRETQARNRPSVQSGSRGRDTFSPLLSPFAPYSIPVWNAALQAVDRSLLVEPSKYAFPDPGLFVTPVKDEKKAKFIHSWLRIRDAWMFRVAQEGSLAMSSQEWRDYLSADLSDMSGSSLSGDTKAAKQRQRILKIVAPTDPELKLRSNMGEPIYWNGHGYLPGSMPPVDVVRQILWNLYELNFHQELVSLDRRACAELDLANSLQLLERQELISKCFAAGLFRSARCPDNNYGFAADSLRNRGPYVLALVQVMQSWKGTKPAIFPLAKQAIYDLSDKQVENLEEIATKYYCQQFYSYFGRAAQVPHRLFLTI